MGRYQQSLRWYGSGLTDFWMIGKFDLPDWCNGGKFLSGLVDLLEEHSRAFSTCVLFGIAMPVRWMGFQPIPAQNCVTSS